MFLNVKTTFHFDHYKIEILNITILSEQFLSMLDLVVSESIDTEHHREQYRRSKYFFLNWIYFPNKACRSPNLGRQALVKFMNYQISGIAS